MTASLGHRGPDETGLWTDGAVGLGNRRLRVVDIIAAAGEEPREEAAVAGDDDSGEGSDADEAGEDWVSP